MRRREIDGCPVSGALQMIGDKWTLLIARDLADGARRTMVLQNGLERISSRTLVARLRDMEKDKLIKRTDFGGNPPHIEYALTERGRVLCRWLMLYGWWDKRWTAISARIEKNCLVPIAKLVRNIVRRLNLSQSPGPLPLHRGVSNATTP